MKKHLLLGAALFSAISAFPQAAKTGVQSSGAKNLAASTNQKIINRLHANENSPLASNVSTAPEGEPENSALRPSSTSSFVTTWNPFTGGMNVYGVVEAATRPLQYAKGLNAVSFVHRKSNTYAPTPVPTSTSAASGAVVTMVSQDWGNTWDSTCVWNDNTRWARYPQGAIYNSSPTNTDISTAYIVAAAPITQINTALGWIGSSFASKQLGGTNYNTTASAVPNAMQFIANTPPYPSNIGKLDFAAYEFSSTDDGKVRALGYVNNDPNGTSSLLFGYRGAKVMTGTFNTTTSTFDWVGDSIIPPVTLSGGVRNIIARPHMAWSESGQVGYVVHIGCRTGATGSNIGFQPIIHKTVNGGNSWALVSNHIDFDAPSMLLPVMDHVLSTNSNSNVTIPFFDNTEGIGLTVDKDDKLHIASILKGTFSPDPDSLGFSFSFANADGESYGYRHTPGLRPYLYDFTGDGTGPWKVTVVDSLSSEAPGEKTTDDGYSTNPWDATGGTTNDKVAIEARIQLSRTNDGKYIVYTFAESDTSVTIKKWNTLPNVKARLMDVATGNIYSNEINITRPALLSQRNNKVDSRAYLHYVAPRCAVAQTITIGASGPAIIMPITVSNNSGLTQLTAITHRYASAALNFGGIAEGDVVLPPDPRPTITLSIDPNSLSSANSSFIYPNPAQNAAILAIDLKHDAALNVSVMNMVGQVVRTSATKAQAGQNVVNIDLNNLSKGIYMVNIKVNNASSTKKLVIE